MFRSVIMTSPEARGLESFAARELTSYLKLLFEIDVSVMAMPTDGEWALPHFVIGRDTDPHIRRVVGQIPSLSPQGYVIRRVNAHTLVLAGGSGAALAWAVYELLEHFGVRFLLHTDVMPRDPGAFVLPDLDLIREPIQSLRSWRIFSELATGPVVWSLKQQKQFMNQLFKLRFNAVYCCLWPHQPLVDFQLDGIRRRTSEVLFGEKFLINVDNIGREHLGSGDALTNPELVHAHTYEEKLAAGKRLIHGILDHARSLEMHVSACIFPFEFPSEFRPLLQKPTEHEIQSGDLCCSERGDLENAGHIELAATVFRAYLNEYGSKIDELYLGLPEHPQAGEAYRPAWQKLAGKYKLEPEFGVQDLVDRARRNQLNFGGAERSVREITSTISMLNFLDGFFDRTGLLHEAQERDVRVGLTLGGGSVDILPLLDRILWPNAMVSTLLGYTSSRSVRRLADMGRLNSEKVSAALIMTLQDDNVGSMPQVATESIHILLQEMHALGWRGYLTRFWPIGDLDPVAAYLSRASWNASSTPTEVYADHFTHAIGPRSMPDCCRVMRILEDMTVILDMNFLGLLFPTSGVMKQFLTPKRMEDGLFHVRAMLEQCRLLLRRIQTYDEGPVDRAARMAYWISRMTFSIELLNEVEYLHEMSLQFQAAQAGEADQNEKARQSLTRALEAGIAALRATADNIRDDSDRGTLAAYFHLAIREVRQFAPIREL